MRKRKERCKGPQSYDSREQYEEHLMNCHKANNEFCFPETVDGEAEGNIEVEGKQTHCFPRGQSLSVLLYLPTQK